MMKLRFGVSNYVWGSVTLALLCLQPVVVAAKPKPTKPLYSYVNPMVGVGNNNQGDTIPGPSLPHGSIHPSPETIVASNAGYDAAEPISGFAQLHSQGSGGVTTYGTFLLSPQVDAPQFDEAQHLSPKMDEVARADQYSVTLQRYNTRVEVAPAHYAAMYRITYPQNSDAQLVIDVTRKVGGLVASDNAEVTIIPEKQMIIGRVKAKGYWNPAKVDIWFCAKFNQPLRQHGIFLNDKTMSAATNAKSGSDQRLGAWLGFSSDQPVLVKIAVSFSSAQKAEDLLDAEIPNWDYEAVQNKAQMAWNNELGRVELYGAGDAYMERFYTSLYHTAIQPRDRSLDQVDSELQAPLWDDLYTLWDQYRTQFPLMSVIKPKAYASNVASMIHVFDKFGAADTAFIGGRNYHVGQGGDEVDNVLGEALIRNVEGINWNDAYRVTHFNAFERRRPRYLIDNYFAVGDLSPEPNNQRAKSGSSTIGFALNDYYGAKVAQKVGKTDEAEVLLKRSSSWRNVWNPEAESDGYTGFIIPRYPDGHFQDIDPKLGWDGITYNNVGFYEGTAWIYSYDMLHDIGGMIEAMGGQKKFADRLEYALKAGLIDITNEPSHSTPWLFYEVNRPDLAQYWSDQVFKKFTVNAYPGDEDAGAMSSHYVFNALGFFPKLGTDLFYIHGPRQPQAVLNLENGNTFVIKAKNSGPKSIYIQKATLNGVALTTPFLKQSDIMKGGRLELEMGEKPSKWGVASSH